MPWSKQVVNDSTIAIVGITAQNGGTGDITCRITVDGKAKTEL
ncbi:MmpS family transport accessory protein [Nocardia sp. NPDC059239]